MSDVPDERPSTPHFTASVFCATVIVVPFDLYMMAWHVEYAVWYYCLVSIITSIAALYFGYQLAREFQTRLEKICLRLLVWGSIALGVIAWATAG